MRQRIIILLGLLLGILMIGEGLILFFFVAGHRAFLRDPASQSLATYFLQSGLFDEHAELSISRSHSALIMVSGGDYLEVEFAGSEQEAIRSLALNEASFLERGLAPPGMLQRGDKLFIFSPSDPATTAIVSQVDLSCQVNTALCAEALIRDVQTDRKTVAAYEECHPGIYGSLVNPLVYELYALSVAVVAKALVSSSWAREFVGNLGLVATGVGLLIFVSRWRRGLARNRMLGP